MVTNNIKSIGGGRRPAEPGRTRRSGFDDAGSRLERNFPTKVNNARKGDAIGAKQDHLIVSDRLDTVGVQLGEARRSAGVTQIKLANQLSTTQSSLARLEKGTSVPNLRTVMNYANAIGYQVSTILSPKSADTSEEEIPPTDLIGKLSNLRKEKSLTQTEVAARMSVTQPIVARLERGDAVPNLRTLDKFASALGFQLMIGLAPLNKSS